MAPTGSPGDRTIGAATHSTPSTYSLAVHGGSVLPDRFGSVRNASGSVTVSPVDEVRSPSRTRSWTASAAYARMTLPAAVAWSGCVSPGGADTRRGRRVVHVGDDCRFRLVQDQGHRPVDGSGQAVDGLFAVLRGEPVERISPERPGSEADVVLVALLDEVPPAASVLTCLNTPLLDRSRWRAMALTPAPSSSRTASSTSKLVAAALTSRESSSVIRSRSMRCHINRSPSANACPCG